ncbi:MAG: MobF family relaxase [Elusimicrobiota bacterium]
MLISMKLTGSAKALAAYHAKEENYYFAQAGGVIVHGLLAPILGFKDGQALSQADLENLLTGKNAGGRQLGRAEKVMGIDLTFSAPKSVSIAGLLSVKDPTIIAAHDEAVMATMREIEKFHAWTRLRTKSLPKPVQTGNMVYATVRDGFNREHDPHLHSHVVVMNMTDHRGKIMTLDGRRIMRQDFNKMWGAFYRHQLAAELQKAGYSISYTEKGMFRMDAVSLELERAFSTRRQEIKSAKDKGIRDMAAWRQTRKEKDPEVEKAGVLAAWQKTLESCRARTAEQNRDENAKRRKAWYLEAVNSLEARQELSGTRGQSEEARWKAAVRRATEQQAVVTADALITEYLAEVGRSEAWERFNYAEARRRLDAQALSGNVVRTDAGGYTSWEMVKADREAVKGSRPAAGLFLNQARDAVSRLSQRAAARGERILSEPQASAAAAILSSRDNLLIIQGDAGAGKTAMLKAVGDIAKGQGWEPRGVAVQGTAARKLEEESGIDSQTLASYLAQEEARARREPGSKRVPRLVVFDEASMVGSRDLAKLRKNVEAAGDKLVLVGDRNQLQAIGAGRPFDRLAAQAEAKGDLLQLSENFRQRDAKLRAAVDLARQGDMRKSLELLNKAGHVAQIKDAYVRRLAVAEHYDKNTLIITGGRDSRDELNAIIRADLVKRGELSEKGRIYELSVRDADGVYRVCRHELAPGDVVTFLENEYKAYDVRNGERGQVLSTRERGLTVKLEDGRAVDLDLDKYAALDYGYAVTTYKSQGQTFDKVVVEADTASAALQDQRNTYVQITRARDAVKIITDDKAELRSLAGVLSYKADTLDAKISYARAKAEVQRDKARAVRPLSRTPAFEVKQKQRGTGLEI